MEAAKKVESKGDLPPPYQALASPDMAHRRNRDELERINAVGFFMLPAKLPKICKL
jgi:hypothetical protein